MSTLSDYPARVQHSTTRPDVEYVLEPGYHARYDARTGEVEVREKSSKPTAGGEHPVYKLGGGSFAVPTGLVFIRFREGENAKDRTADIIRAGYHLADTSEYAPHTAWVRAASGQICDALRQLAALGALGGVENVEPQFVMQRSARP